MKLLKLSELRTKSDQLQLSKKCNNRDFGNFVSFARYIRARVRKCSNLAKKLEKV
jgi:hypothetical protein